MRYDYVIIGAGLFGLTAGRLLKDKGYNVVIYEKRPHIGGNCWSYVQKCGDSDINVHAYGSHIFHTDTIELWNFVNKFENFNPFDFRVKARREENDKINYYSFPINLMTLNQLFGFSCQVEAELYFTKQNKNNNENWKNLKDFALYTIGNELYEKFIESYCIKQWGKDPKDLPASILQRIPYRTTMNDKYYPDNHLWVGIPENGWDVFLQNLAKDIDIYTSCKIVEPRDFFGQKGIIYTGEIDSYFDYKYGKLEYRSLVWDKKYNNNIKSFQGAPIVVYPQAKIPYTRIIEHKHFNFRNNDKIGTIYGIEYSVARKENDQIPMYPIQTKYNKDLYEKYHSLANLEKNVWFGGRLGTYTYLDMDKCIKSAMELVDEL